MARKAKAMNFLDKDLEAKAKQEEMNTEKIWKEYITRILPEALQAHALAENASSDEVTPRNRHAYARYTAALDALKSSADALYWTIVPWRAQTGTQTIEALIETAERLTVGREGVLEISEASRLALAEYYEQ